MLLEYREGPPSKSLRMDECSCDWDTQHPSRYLNPKWHMQFLSLLNLSKCQKHKVLAISCGMCSVMLQLLQADELCVTIIITSLDDHRLIK